MEIAISRAETNDYQAIQRFLEDAYGHSWNFFPLFYPSVWRKETTDFRHILLVREKGQILSLVRIFPLKLILGKVTLPVAGIGGVATSPRDRGRGYMTALMNQAVQIMHQEGFPLSILWGDRHRYCHFGYENAGTVLEVQIGARGLQKISTPELPVHRYLGEKKVLARIYSLYQENPFRKERTLEEMSRLQERSGLLTYYVEQEKQLAYISFSGERTANAVFEFGGRAHLLVTILKYYQARFGVPTFVLSYPGVESVPEEILQVASCWWFKTAGMLRIVDLKKLLQCYRLYLEDVFPEKGEIIFKRGGQQALKLSREKGKLSIKNGRYPESLSLSEEQLTRLLFGPGNWLQQNTVARQIFPLPFFVWPLDHI